MKMSSVFYDVDDWFEYRYRGYFTNPDLKTEIASLLGERAVIRHIRFSLGWYVLVTSEEDAVALRLLSVSVRDRFADIEAATNPQNTTGSASSSP